MLFRLGPISRWITSASCSIVFAIVLVACGGSGNGGSTPTPILTPTPTSPPPTPTPIPVITFMGNGFTINYPQGWKTTKSGDHLVTFTDSTGNLKLTITVAPDPNGAVSADSFVDTEVKAAMAALKNSQMESAPSTVTVGGDSWNQKSASGIQRLNNQDTLIQLVVLADVHPANAPTSKAYTIVYGTAKSMFDQANTTYFQPMLQSFKFM